MAESIPHMKRRRDKPVLSCSFCRGRKIRCDRLSPCNTCVRRGRPEQCTYSSSEQERNSAIDYRPHFRSNQNARQRIARLESLVAEMRDMAQGSYQRLDDIESSSDASKKSRAPITGSHNHVNDTLGKLSITDGDEVYTGGSHWVAILEEIGNLKEELSSDEQSNDIISRESTPLDAGFTHGTPPTRISLLAGATCLEREQVLAMLPPRKVVDRHLSHFFNTFDLAPVILHRKSFLAEYAQFWQNPSAVPIMWLALLFSILTISINLQQHEIGFLGISAKELQDMVETYRTLTIHCLVAGDYLRPSRYTLETLALHFTIEQNVSLDTYVGNWILIGVVIRTAFRMGLHRDPSHWPRIRPLQAEMRRRLWMALYQMDFFTSTQIGLPRIIKDAQCDTRPPLFLLDDDIDSEHNDLPPEQPSTDLTPLSHLIQRNTIIKVTAQIYDETEAAPPSSETIAALSARLDEAIGTIPTRLRHRPMESSIADNPVAILHRITLDILIHKAVYILHRWSFMKGTGGQENTKSNELCITAALTILEHQRTLSEETRPGGHMFTIRWKVTSSVNHVFLQASMMLCFVLNRLNEGCAEDTNSYAVQSRNGIIEALKIARTLWEEVSDRSIEAQRATRTITAVLQPKADKSSLSNMMPYNGLFEQMPGAIASGYMEDFDYGDGMNLDPSLLLANDDATTFGNMLDEFVTSQVAEEGY